MTVATVPICDKCWHEHNGDRVPTRMRDPEKEHCYICGQETLSGIYVRDEIDDNVL